MMPGNADDFLEFAERLFYTIVLIVMCGYALDIMERRIVTVDGVDRGVISPQNRGKSRGHDLVDTADLLKST